MKSNDALNLPDNPTLADFQNYVIQLKKVRSFGNDVKNTLIFLFNEFGELSQTIVKSWRKEQEPSEETRSAISLELADVFIFLLDLANQYNISMEEAFRKKEEINKLRTWNTLLT